MEKSYSEQIKEFEGTLTAHKEARDALMKTAAEEARSLDADEEEKFEEADGKVKSTLKHIERLRNLQAEEAAAAKPLSGIDTVEKGSAARGVSVVSAMKDNLPPGIEFARYVMCLASAKGNPEVAHSIAKSRYPDQQRVHTVLKAAVNAGTTTDASWAGNLVDYQMFAGDFINYLRPETLIGKFGQGGVPSLRRVPFNIEIPRQTSSGNAWWVGEGAPKPLTNMAFDKLQLRWAKIATIAVLTEELVRFSNPSAEALVRDELAAAVIERMDRDFVDPSKAAVSNVSPASITNGVSAIPSSGTDEDAVRADVRSVMQAFIDGNLRSSRGVWMMSESNALALSLMMNPLGQPSFPGVNASGGTFMGRPVITSQYMGSIVVYVIPEEILLADDGQVVIDASREASLQMLDNPTNNSGTATATTLVSMFQTNSIALRAERFINWVRRRNTAVAWLDDVDWGTASGSDA